MGVKYGSPQSQAMWKKETAWGTEVTADSYFGRLKGYSFTFSDAKVESYDLGERGAKNHLYGPFGVKGNVDFYLVGDSADTEASAIFELLLGGSLATGDGSVSTPYTYPDSTTTSYAAGIRTLPSATIELGKNDATTDTNWTMPGCVCGGGSISISKDGLIEVSTSWVGKTVAIDTTIVSYAPASTLIPFNAATTVFKQSGTSIGTVESASITIDNGLIEGRGLNDRLLQTLIGGQQKLTWECTVVMDTDLLTTLYASAYGQEAVASGPLNTGEMGIDAGLTIALECTNGDTPEVAYEFTLGNAVITEHSEAIEQGNNLCMVKFSGMAKTLIVTHNNQAD